MGLEVFDGENVYSFYYRRPLSIKQCKEEKDEYLKMLEGTKTFRIVGQGFLNTEQKPIPKHFISKHKLTSKKLIATFSGPFIRLQVGKKCKAYFSNYCELPQNYWAGTIPPPDLKNKE